MEPSFSKRSTFITFLVVIAVVLLGYILFTMPDKRSGKEKVHDAADELTGGVRKATRQLEDRIPAEKFDDAVKDASDDIKKNTTQP